MYITVFTLTSLVMLATITIMFLWMHILISDSGKNGLVDVCVVNAYCGRVRAG